MTPPDWCTIPSDAILLNHDHQPCESRCRRKLQCGMCSTCGHRRKGGVEGPCENGCQVLQPWARWADCAPGWEILLPSARVAGVHCSVIIQQADLAVTMLEVDVDTFTCLLHGMELIVIRRGWGALDSFNAQDAALPVDGVLSNRHLHYTNPGGQRLLAQVPVFTAEVAA